MPVSDPTVVDGMGVDPETGNLLMHMWEERTWDNAMGMLSDIERKVGVYLNFLTSGQLDEYPAFQSRRVQIQVFFQYLPPELAKVIIRKLAAELSQKGVGFAAFHGPTAKSRQIPL